MSLLVTMTRYRAGHCAASNYSTILMSVLSVALAIYLR